MQIKSITKSKKQNTKFLINKKSLFALILMMMLSIPMTLQFSQITAKAAENVPTYLFVTASPERVGVGQTVYISLFFSKPIPASSDMMFGGSLYENLTVNIVMPDGTNKTLGPYTTDTVGGVGGIEFVPTMVGNYILQAFYPGQTLAGAAGTKLNADVSSPDTLTVQQDPIATYSSPALPTGYWSRPIYSTNYGWAELGGNWWGLGRPSFANSGGYDASNNNFNAYSKAVNAAHIVWTKETAFGGQVGLPIASDQTSQYSSTSPLYQEFNPTILNGILYYNWYPSSSINAGIVALDIRTGKTLWTMNTTDIISFGQVMKFRNNEEFGSQAFLWTISGSKYNIYDPLSGAYLASVINVPSTLAGIFSASAGGLVDVSETNCQGSVLIYWVENGNLTMWNSTQSLTTIGAFFDTPYKPTGNYNFSAGIMWSVPLPTKIGSNDISPSLGISQTTNDAILVTSYPAVIPTFLTSFGESYAIDAAYNPITGKLLWGPVNQTLTRFNELDVIAAGDGYYVRHDKDTNKVYGYSLVTGALLWGPVQLEGNALSSLMCGGAIAYGKVYLFDFGGYVNAIDLKTGTLSWTFTRGSAGYDTPYGIYPIWAFYTHSIADGKLFLSEGRLYNPPAFPNAHRLAINCTDGSLVWSILNFDTKDPAAIADGYVLTWNSYDCQIYNFGKGQTATTATIQNNVLPLGGSVLITGTVTDQSPGTQNSDRIARFPDGVPAVSDASMSSFMEYVYMQQPEPTNAMGVPVHLTAIDSNGNTQEIGTATSNSMGNYAFAWTPPISGLYTITATFAGTESYYSSKAGTSLVVSAASPSPSIAPQSASDISTLTYVAIATVFVIIAIIAATLVLRRHK